MMSTQDDLTMLREHLAELTTALAGMGKSKVGTPWHLDRVRERDSIARQIERLEAIEPAPGCGRFVPGEDDEAARLELAVAGAFLPPAAAPQPRPRRGRWGKAK